MLFSEKIFTQAMILVHSIHLTFGITNNIEILFLLRYISLFSFISFEDLQPRLFSLVSVRDEVDALNFKKLTAVKVKKLSNIRFRYS